MIPGNARPFITPSQVWYLHFYSLWKVASARRANSYYPLPISGAGAFAEVFP